MLAALTDHLAAFRALVEMGDSAGYGDSHRALISQSFEIFQLISRLKVPASQLTVQPKVRRSTVAVDARRWLIAPQSAGDIIDMIRSKRLKPKSRKFKVRSLIFSGDNSK